MLLVHFIALNECIGSYFIYFLCFQSTLSHATPFNSLFPFICRSFSVCFINFHFISASALNVVFQFFCECSSAISHISISKRDKDIIYNVKIWMLGCKSHCDLLYSFLDSILTFHCLKVQSQCFK